MKRDPECLSETCHKNCLYENSLYHSCSTLRQPIQQVVQIVTTMPKIESNILENQFRFMLESFTQKSIFPIKTTHQKVFREEKLTYGCLFRLNLGRDIKEVNLANIIE